MIISFAAQAANNNIHAMTRINNVTLNPLSILVGCRFGIASTVFISSVSSSIFDYKFLSSILIFSCRDYISVLNEFPAFGFIIYTNKYLSLHSIIHELILSYASFVITTGKLSVPRP